jgi:hypothetical protein
MSNIPNLRIITELGELVYKQVEDLNLSFNRIVDDFTDIGNRFGDFSYEFNVPIIKENSKIFGAPETIGSKGYFVKNRNILCKVYNNNQLILDGLVSLEGITKDSYKCKFFSRFKELTDSLNEKQENGDDKTLRNLNLPIISGWTYEESIISHINANYLSSDETDYQYPLTYYSTFYCEEDAYKSQFDDQGYYFSSDRPRQNWYFLINNISYNNRFYFHQIPPAIYLVSIVKQILTDAGWTIGGQFFNQENVKKILLLYNGGSDPYDKAIANQTEDQILSGSTPVDLRLASFLPDWSQADFLKGVINMFNLYFRIDTNNKIIEFETYNTYFKNTDEIDPYNLDGKIMEDASGNEFTYFETNNPTIKFKAAGNRNILGDSKLMSGYTDNAFQTKWISTDNLTFNQTFNRIGFLDQGNSLQNIYGTKSSKIELPFAEPTIKRQYIYNNRDITGTNKSATWHYIYLPMMTKQKVNDNAGMKFNKSDDDSYVQNDESSIKFEGEPTLMYYYGIPTTTIENKTAKGSLANYMYINIYTDTGTTLNRVHIPVVSPFQLFDYRVPVEEWLDGLDSITAQDRRTTVASYLQSLYQLMVTFTGITSELLTDYSLVFDDNGYFHKTLWSEFHEYKWNRLQQSEVFTGDMRMNSYDWNQMQINRPLLYKNELYSLLEISGFNPITQKAKIKMIKKL